MRISFDLRQQHDSNGNAYHLLSEEDRAKFDAGECRRTDQNCLCEVCGEPWWKHPPVIGALWLTKACNGEHLKL